MSSQPASDIAVPRDAENDALCAFARRTAHDLNNLLTIIQGYGDLLVEDLAGQPELRGAAEELLAASVRVGDFSARLSALGREYRASEDALGLGDFLAERQPVLAARAGSDRRLECRRVEGGLAVKATAEDLARILDELVANAAEATAAGGEITVSARPGDDAPLPPGLSTAPCCVIRVADNGAGFADSLLDTARQPFVTTKPRQQGAGLGLAIVDRIARQLGGAMTLDNPAGGGAVVAVYLPRAS